jgi:outer membrane protein, heavy metal efflux system
MLERVEHIEPISRSMRSIARILSGFGMVNSLRFRIRCTIASIAVVTAVSIVARNSIAAPAAVPVGVAPQRPTPVDQASAASDLHASHAATNQPEQDTVNPDPSAELVLAAGSTVPNSGAGLTLKSVMHEVLASGFETRLANITVDAARGDARGFSAISNPAVTIGAGRALGYDPNTAGGSASATQYSLGLSDQAAISGILSGKHGLKKEIGRQSVRLASLQRDDAIRVVQLLAKQQYGNIVFSQARLRLSERILRSALETEKLVRARYNAGGPLPDLLRAEAVTLDAEQGLRAAQIQLTTSRAQLALLMGRQSLDNVSFDESMLTATPPVVDVPPPASLWVEQAKTKRPDRVAAETAVELSESTLRLARRNRWPDVELQLGYTQQGLGNSAIQPATVSIALSAPIPILYQNQGQIDRATADSSARSVERQRLDMQIASAVKTSLLTVASAWEQARNASERLVRARRAFEMVRLQYQEGGTSLVDLLEATRAANDAEDNFLEAKESFWGQLFQLEFDAGKELVN